MPQEELGENAAIQKKWLRTSCERARTAAGHSQRRRLRGELRGGRGSCEFVATRHLLAVIGLAGDRARSGLAARTA